MFNKEDQWKNRKGSQNFSRPKNSLFQALFPMENAKKTFSLKHDYEILFFRVIELHVMDAVPSMLAKPVDILLLKFVNKKSKFPLCDGR